MIRSKLALYTILTIVLSVLLLAPASYAQSQQITPASRAGYSFVLGGANVYGKVRPTFGGSIDLPSGSLFLSPGVHLYNSIDSCFAGRFLIGGAIASHVILQAGPELSVWSDRVGLGLPVKLSYLIPVAERVQLTFDGEYQPLFYLGPQKFAGIYGIFAGVRIPVASKE